MSTESWHGMWFLRYRTTRYNICHECIPTRLDLMDMDGTNAWDCVPRNVDFKGVHSSGIEQKKKKKEPIT